MEIITVLGILAVGFIAGGVGVYMLVSAFVN